MKQLFISLFVGLCVIQSNAQTTIITIPQKCIEPRGIIKLDSNITAIDSVSFVYKLEQVFKKRRNERIWQLTEYLSYLHNNKAEHEKMFYITSVLALFANDTHVKIRNEGFKQDIGLREFLIEYSLKQLNTTIYIDSIEIPKWDHAQIESDTLGVVYSTCEMTAIQAVVNKTYESQPTLPLVKDLTEDGFEWVPLFGNMIVTLNKNEDNKKNNWNSLNSVNDQLR